MKKDLFCVNESSDSPTNNVLMLRKGVDMIYAHTNVVDRPTACQHTNENIKNDEMMCFVTNLKLFYLGKIP